MVADQPSAFVFADSGPETVPVYNLLVNEEREKVLMAIYTNNSWANVVGARPQYTFVAEQVWIS